MYPGGNGTNSRSSRFTAHAAVQLQRYYNKPAYMRYGEADSQKLEVQSHENSDPLIQRVRKTFPRCNINIIHRVNAPQMYGMYLLRKEEMQLTPEYCREIILYHVTTKSRALESLISGLDWRRTRRSKFGRGVSFSDDADYANYYADNFPKEDKRVIIVCTVLVKKTHSVSGKPNDKKLMIPLGTADTTVSTNGRVYVKYNDYDFYPMYLMYYQRTPELINESKYFRINPNNRIQQNHLVAQQKELQAQREVQEAQRRRELQAQRYLEQVPRQRQVWDQERRRQLLLEQGHYQQVQAPRSQDQTRRHESSSDFYIISLMIVFFYVYCYNYYYKL
ncbi:uncharacterized protein LOC132920399 isoform X1 [Rhopalosiphum padi]|uniref:uncharacterized protein LOC132920399 isoform X1 n=1 Tax=Rhopalosiphum padi TaxID=40932 RepID=UPI00298E22EF|nr:uncharacterized protein LOC132920399 isoform X1 [Rhopalosiphum padi]XP_060838751.1 uncharacterized protein LOC132920399 isoform X1 [Rhopalosiphum padi]XP_060838752.1 uncharacterized protein LOC132920399 isoform X1 [Rhopalosiphum padi]XP_060838753.1 uncharacterized protein LOC132920399 isoform X1 [Rhopalosiphum padi]XP_060838754.1 uncharacterized protein LOC132920399 isoform X1 [Rhopalosiphum padi]